MAELKLSEAIREGAKRRPQTFGSSFATLHDGVHSCAIGAAIEGATGETVDINQNFANLFENYDPYGIYSCPECGNATTLKSTIVHLNDNHAWTREQIADWLQKQGY